MRKEKKKLICDDIEFDSKEEIDFYKWAKELQAKGFISKFEYHPKSLELSERVVKTIEVKLKTKTKEKEKFLLNPHIYTADFILWINNSFANLNTGFEATPNTNQVWIDVKGTWNKYESDTKFSINQKWVFQKYGIFINKVIPKKLFKKSFAPNIRHKKTGAELKRFKDCKTIDMIQESLGF